MAESDISNEDRRTMANLSIPRTAAGLAGRMASDPDIPARSAEGIREHLSDLVSRGLVVNLGEGDPQEIADLNEGGDAIGFGKGQKKIWLARAEAGRYDTDGNHYVLSQDGLAAIKGGDDE